MLVEPIVVVESVVAIEVDSDDVEIDCVVVTGADGVVLIVDDSVVVVVVDDVDTVVDPDDEHVSPFNFTLSIVGSSPPLANRACQSRINSEPAARFPFQFLLDKVAIPFAKLSRLAVYTFKAFIWPVSLISMVHPFKSLLV